MRVVRSVGEGCGVHGCGLWSQRVRVVRSVGEGCGVSVGEG